MDGLLEVIAASVARPALLLLAPAALLLLYLLERWRQRPVALTVADVDLFTPTAEAAAEARARRRRLGARWLARAAAAVLLVLAAAGLRRPPAPAGPVTVDLVLDRGLSSGFRARGPQGAERRLDGHVRHLLAVLERLGPEDRARLHLLPNRHGDGPTPPLTPDAARAALRGAAPTAASADLDAALEALVPRALAARAATGAALPVFVASDRLPAAARAAEGAVAVALSGEPRADRGLVALEVGEDGALHATVGVTAADAAAAPVEVEVVLAARTGAGVDAQVTRRVRVAPGGFAFASWTPTEGFPPDAMQASARLLGEDALPANDRAFAARPPVQPRRVGVLGELDPRVRAALLAVPGVELVRLASLPRPAEALRLELVVVRGARLPEPLPEAALLLLPAEPLAPARVGGALSALAHPAFPHTASALAGGLPVAVARAGTLPRALGSLEPLLLAGDAPLVALTGAGRRLVAVATAPLDPPGSGWTLDRSFPLFWAELLELAAPRGEAELAAIRAGAPWPAGVSGPAGTATSTSGAAPARVPLTVERVRGPDGRALLGTVAAPLLARPSASERGFAPEALARIDAARPPGRPRPLAPWLALAAAALALASWAPSRTRTTSRTGRLERVQAT